MDEKVNCPQKPGALIGNQVSADYEQVKSEQRIKVETVTREVQKIIDRPVYNNVCLDDDGLQQLNSLITGNTSEPP